MGQDFRSANWYRVAGVKPRLAPQVRAQRQVFRGVVWYVLFDPINQRTHRLTPQAWNVVARMDGARTVEQLWRQAADERGDEAPPQDELIQLLAQLHEANALVSDALPDLDELTRRRDQEQRQRLKRNLGNPLSIRFRFWDPDAFLARTLPAVRWVFGPVGALLWFAVTLPALVLVAMHWHQLATDVSDRLLSASSLLTMLFVYPLVKGLHEMAHAYAAKVGGAAVHDMGVMFLVFAPMPYVDASGSTAFHDKRRRALVAGAGMLMELFLGALALYVWLLVEPGLLRSVAFSVMLIGGASTLLFNGNPLMRYDGYFVMCDLIETPNLAQRSNQFWGWLVRRFAFGLAQARAPQATTGERVWFGLYAPLSFAYRLFITAGIALFLGREYLALGLAVGVWGLVMLAVWPAIKGLHYVWASSELTGRRERPLALTVGVLGLLAVLLVAVPVPVTTYAQGQVWPAENAQLRPEEPGFVSRVAVHTGDRVGEGALVAVLDNDSIDTDRDAAAARADRQRRSFVALLADVDHQPETAHARVAAGVQEQEWLRAADDLGHAELRRAKLVVPALREGRIELPRSADLPGRWLKRGELFGYVVTDDAPSVRVVVTQDDIDLVRGHLQRVDVRLSGDLGRVWPAKLLREVPGGNEGLPSQALTLEGGGLIAADARDAGKPRALNRVFEFDLELPAEARDAHIGERAHVRFVHASEPLASQAWRRLRQLLLSQLTL